MRTGARLAPVGVDEESRTIAAILSSRAATGRPESWASLVRRAIEERVAPLLYWALREDESIPDASRNELRSELYRAEAANLVLYRELERLLKRAAEEAASPPVILKGGALATGLYDEIGLRPMSDLDLLVPREELRRWLEWAREVGFRRLSPEMARGLTEAVHYQVALVAPEDDGAVLEIHFGLVSGPSDWRAPGLPWFFARTEPWSPPRGMPSRVVSQLDPTAHLLYLSAHAMLQHGAAQARMIWFHDLHLLVSRRGRDIRWAELVDEARQLRWDGALSAALTRTRDLFGSVLPEDLLPQLDRGADERGRRFLRRRSDPSMSRAELVWSELGSQSSWERLRWMLAILFPSPDYMRWRYPRAGVLWPVGYLYRFMRVVWEGAQALVGRARRGPAAPPC